MKTWSTAAKTSYITFRLREHVAVFNGSEPEAVGVGIVVTGSTTVALDKWSTAEFLQAGTRGGQSLSGALGTSASVLHKHKQCKHSSKNAYFHPHTSNVHIIDYFVDLMFV